MSLIWHLRNIHLKFKYRKCKIGDKSRINIGVSINIPQNVFIGSGTYINGGVLVTGQNSKIIIGNNCLISYNVHIRTISHNYIRRDILIREQGEYEKNIIIEDDVWIGYGAQIMPGVTVHKGAVIGAGAVVTHDVAEYTVVGGVPAKEIKRRI